MKQLHLTIVALVTLATPSQAQSPSSQLGCSGQLIEPRAKKSAPKTLQLTISSEKVGVDLGSGNVAAKVESNNNIQLKFTTDEFTGEYFHYTGDSYLQGRPSCSTELQTGLKETGSTDEATPDRAQWPYKLVSP